MERSISISKVIGGALLVGGTSIGAGMLALPVVTGYGGFLPACVIYLICYLFSTATGLLLLEICYWMPQDANIVSMAKYLLGPFGKAGAWILYLFLFYFLTIAYVAGGGSFVTNLFNAAFPQWLGIILFTMVFGAVVYFGTRMVDRVNFILMIGLVISYVAFVILGVKYVEFELLQRTHWGPAILALPVIFTSFSYQGIIPSLNTYLGRNPKMVRIAIFVGTAIPFVAYTIWEFLILGIVSPEGEHGLIAAKANGEIAVESLRYVLSDSYIYSIGQFFGSFALTTSFLGVTLGLMDFLADGLQVQKVGWKKIFLCAIIYIPPVIIAIVNPNIFLSALGYAGGVGCGLLLGIFPTLMVWVGRYKKNYPTVNQQLFGGKVMLSLLFLFVIFELIVEGISEFIFT